MEGGRGPERGVRHRENGRQEEAEVENKGDRSGREEVDGSHHVEEPKLQHPGEHVCRGWPFPQFCTRSERKTLNSIIYHPGSKEK